MFGLILAFDIIIHGSFRSVPLALGKCGPEAEGCREHGYLARNYDPASAPKFLSRV